MKIIKTILLSFAQAIGIMLFGSTMIVFVFGGSAAVLLVVYYLFIKFAGG